MTQHTSNNRNTNIPNTINSGIQYSHKTRTRAARARVGAVRKPSFSEKQPRSCPRCKESANSVKMLTARVGKIECLVNALAKTTYGLTSMSKREDRFSQHNLRIGEIDLTNCSLQELQKLVVATTNIMVPSKKLRLSTPTSPVRVNNTIMTDVKPICSEPESEENVDEKIQEKDSEQNHHQQPITPTSPVKTATSTLKRNKSLRQDSGFEESKHSSSPDGTPN